MILLHLAVAALYGLAAWAHWPAAADASASRDAAPPFPRSLAGWLLPLAVAAHAWLALSDIARPELLAARPLSGEEQALLAEFQREAQAAVQQ